LNAYFLQFNSLIEGDRTIDSKVGTSDTAVSWNQNQIEKRPFSWKSAKGKIEHEFSVFPEISKVSSGSGWENGAIVNRQKPDHSIEIDDFVQIIHVNILWGSHSLTEIVFSSKNNVREIWGFARCRSFCRAEIPSSVEIIETYGFVECISLNKMIFSSDNHLREADGFAGCISFDRIEIPSSVEVIGRNGFLNCS
jgi:hypothetical protein